MGRLLDEKGYVIENIDATIIAQRPKMRPYIDQMRENIAAGAEDLETDQVNVKATTEEGLGFTGAGEGDFLPGGVRGGEDILNYGSVDVTEAAPGVRWMLRPLRRERTDQDDAAEA